MCLSISGIFDVETDFARQFDLQSFVSDGKTGHLIIRYIIISKHIFVGIHALIDKHISHNNIASNLTRKI
jgi:hypothetical protein